MKSICILSFAFALAAGAQTPATSPQAPPAAPPAAAPAPAHPSPETVIATIDGRNLTYSEVEKYVRSLPPQMQQQALRNRTQFIQQYALLLRLSEMAEKAKLYDKSPYKESLETNRRNILTQAQINEIYNTLPVRAEDQKKYYEENKGKYDQVKVKVIYISFGSGAVSSSTDIKKHLSEDDAKARAVKLVQEARGGADFVKLVKENSEDATSKAKDGDFGTLSRADNLPDPIRSVIFALKAGDVSEPVRQPNGFYIFRAEEISQKPYEAVSNDIYSELKRQRLNEWMESTIKSLNIKIENEQAFPGSVPPAPPTLQPVK